MDFQLPRRRAASSSHSKYSEQLNKLTEMGFAESSVINALEKANGNIDIAMGILLDEKPSVELRPISTSTESNAPQHNSVKSNSNSRQKPDMKEIHKKFMKTYKVQKCKDKVPHDKRHCVNWHGKSDRRRNPFEILYKPSECQHCTETTVCSEGDSCLRSHNMLERMFHPELFKISMCQRGANGSLCERGNFCAFAHSEDDLRAPQINVQTGVPPSTSEKTGQDNTQSNHQLKSPESKSLDGDSVSDKLSRLIFSCGKGGIALFDIPKKYSDMYSEKLEIINESGSNQLQLQQQRLGEMLLTIPYIRLVLDKVSQVICFYDENIIDKESNGRPSDVTTNGTPNSNSNSNGSVYKSSEDNNNEQQQQQHSSMMSTMSMSMSMMRREESLPPLPLSLPLLSHLSLGQTLLTSSSSSMQTPPPPSLPNGPSSSSSSIVIRPRPRGPAFLPNQSLEDIAALLQMPGPSTLSSMSSLTTSGIDPSPLSLSDPVFYDIGNNNSNNSMNMNIPPGGGGGLLNLRETVSSSDHIQHQHQHGGMLSSDSMALSSFQRAIGTAVGHRRRGPSLSLSTVMDENNNINNNSINSINSTLSQLTNGPFASSSSSSSLMHSAASATQPLVSSKQIHSTGSIGNGGNGSGGSSSESGLNFDSNSSVILQFTKQIERLNIELESRTKLCNEQALIIADTNTKQQELQRKHETVLKEKEIIEEQYRIHKDNIVINQELNTSQTRELSTLREAFKEKEIALSKAEATKNSLIPELKLLRTKISTVEKDFENAKNMLKCHDTENERKRALLQAEVDSLKSDLNIARSQIGVEKSARIQQYEIMQNTIATSEKTLAVMEGELKRSLNMISVSESMQEDLRKEISRLKKEPLAKSFTKVVSSFVELTPTSSTSTSTLATVTTSPSDESSPTWLAKDLNNQIIESSTANSVIENKSKVCTTATTTTTNNSNNSSINPESEKSSKQTITILACALPGCESKGFFRCSACNDIAYCGMEHQ
eukprot:gene709-1361_t